MNGAIHAYTRQRTADEIVAACVDARVPAAVVGNGAELPRNEQLAARGVFVRQPGEPWIRPRAPFRFHRVPDRELVAPGVASGPWRPRSRPAPSPDRSVPGDRPLAGIRVLDFTAFWAGPFATAWLSSMGADVVKVEAVQRPDGIRFSAAVRPHDDSRFYEKSALFHACNLAKRGIKFGEASWVLEDNMMMSRAAELMNGKPYKRYRVFEKALYQGEERTGSV